MKTRSIPEDTALVSESDVSDDEWKRAATAHERFKRLLETKPQAKARFDVVLAEIDSRQATLRRLREARSLTQSTVADC